MTQTELDDAVSRATGDDLRTIRGQGFSLVEPAQRLDDDDRDPLTVDWDQLDLHRATSLFPA